MTTEKQTNETALKKLGIVISVRKRYISILDATIVAAVCSKIFGDRRRVWETKPRCGNCLPERTIADLFISPASRADCLTRWFSGGKKKKK